MFSEILFDKLKYQGYKVVGLGEENQIKNLSKINILIGQNNSGKSRFVRTLFSDDDFDFLLSKSDISLLKETIDECHKHIRQVLDNLYIEDADNLFSDLDKMKLSLNYFRKKTTRDIITNIRKVADTFAQKRTFSGYNHKSNIITNSDPVQALYNINTVGTKISKVVNEIFPNDAEFDIHRVYIPILRGLRPTQSNQDDTHRFVENYDNYKKRTLKDYFEGSTEHIKNEIFTGLNLYEDTKKLLLGRKSEREKIKNFEEFLSTNFFNNQPISLIPDFNNDVLLIGIGEEEWPVYNLGDGIQSIIIMLYPLFFNQDKNLLVFIEEPESSLHPGMQRIFIEALQRKEFEKFQYFISTHSNHFLDITLDFKNISVYSFRKIFAENNREPVVIIENVNNEKTNVLDLIGVRNSSIFLSNCTIWVEGITDRLYLRKYLDVYQDLLIQKGKIEKKYREDLNYSFIEYAGSNITHYSFSDLDTFGKIKSSRLSNRILLIADSDNADLEGKKAKSARLETLKQNLGNAFIQVEGKEIENILKENVVLETLAKLEGKVVSDLKFDSAFFQLKNYQRTGLGTFIETNIKKLSKRYAEPSGTIKNKLNFCQTATEFITSFEDLSKPAQQITQKIFEFIDSNNL